MNRKKFQSLIGIYAHCNFSASTGEVSTNSFQSLIGIYAHCNVAGGIAAGLDLVSIPHRDLCSLQRHTKESRNCLQAGFNPS